MRTNNARDQISSIIDWRSLSAARRNACADRQAKPPRHQAPASHRPTFVRSIAWRIIPCRQAPPVADSTFDSLPPGGHTRAARRYTSSETSLVLAPIIDPNLIQSLFQFNHTYCIIIA
ncbi:hypothetical protein DEO72_LG2g2800 [Vigna unguiculata]|uniref:Uncharacterized protein n=1 Tax=Vigna unguiculata TaxID=3917 RepID=A0A4D6L1U1_VIGUN|nr:hypothetical protein DEO72_LG2g2800 [Vigna unguiculata]